MSFSRRIFLYAAALMLSLTTTPVWAEAMSEMSLKAALLYKFAQFTDWPPPSPPQYRLCVLGKDLFEGALNAWQQRKLQGNPVVVGYPSSLNEAKNCQVLFLNPANPNQLSQWVAGLKGLPILTISDQADAWNEGVMIALFTDSNRITFKIDTQVARQVGISFRATMLQVAQEVR